MTPTRIPRRRHGGGFTLMELLIAMSVVALLALIIVPAYTAQVQKSRRGDAKNALLDLAAREERYFATNNTYTSTASTLGYGGTFPVAVSSSGVSSYALSVTAATTTGFTATAAPTGPQANDACGTYTLNDQGTQGNTGNSQTSPPCW